MVKIQNGEGPVNTLIRGLCYAIGGFALVFALYGGFIWLGGQQSDLGEVMALF